MTVVPILLEAHTSNIPILLGSLFSYSQLHGQLWRFIHLAILSHGFFFD